MKLRLLTTFLIFVYGSAILSFSFLEASHTILHVFKNSIHHHQHSHHHGASDHHAVNSTDNSSTSDNDTLSPTHCYLLFFEADATLLNQFNFERQQFSDLERRLLSAIKLLLIPPPKF